MRVAAIAYELLTPAAKTEASRLIKLNPNYAEWVAAIPQPPDGSPRDVDRYTFIRAAVWADDIKLIKAYRDASKKDAPDTPTAGQNIGYADKLIHAYWHYKDLAFSPDGSPLGAPDAVNAATQIKLFEAALPKSAGQSDDIRSYDLVWLLHLVGDAHQPLHAVSMFRADLSVEHQMDNEPDTGDRGGNEITVVPANGQPVSLHAYWDGLLGGYSTPFGAVFDTFGGNPKKDGSGRYIPNILWATGAEASITDPEVWFSESFEVAKATAYADPVTVWP